MSIHSSRRLRFTAAVGLILFLTLVIALLAAVSLKHLAMEAPFLIAALVVATIASRHALKTQDEYLLVVIDWLRGSRKETDFLLATAAILIVIAATTSCVPF